MGLPETPAQCLCPLGRHKGNEIEQRDPHVNDDHIDTFLASSPFSNSDPATQQSSYPPRSHLPSSLLRRSVTTTFFNGADAQQCIDACRQSFLQSGLSSLSPTSSGESLLVNTCSLLSSSSAAQEELWQLYWCDSAFCGVWIDDSGGKGQDPNVDLIINECQNIGYPSVYDPGPPPASYYCSSLLAAGPSANPCRNLAEVATETITATASLTNTMEPTDTTLITQHLSQHLTTAPSPQNTAKSLVIGGNVVSAAAATASTSTNSSNENGKNATTAGASSGPSAGVKGAIVACIIVVVLLIVGIVFFFIRRRRKNMFGQAYQHRGGGDGEGGSGPSRHRPSHANGGSGGSIGLTARLRQQGQMLFYPGQGRGGADGEMPKPLISPANSCNSVRAVSEGTGAPSISGTPKRGGANFLSSLHRTSSNDHASTQSQTSNRSRRILPSFFARRIRDRSVSPPLTSLSPPPSPTQMSARGRHDVDGDHESDHGGMASKNGNRVSAANSGSSYYGYYGYNGHFVPYYFPSSPICAPTTNKLEPRSERTPTIRPSKRNEQQRLEKQKQQQQRHGYYNFQSNQSTDGGSPVPPLPPLPLLPVSIFSSQAGNNDASTSHRGPRSSYGSYSTVTNASSTIVPSSNLYGNAVTADTMELMKPLSSISPLPGLSGYGSVVSTSATSGKPASPARPKRPHESPLEIPDLVMPNPPLPFLFHTKNVSTIDRSFSMPGRTYSVSSGGRKAVIVGSMAVTAPRLPSASINGSSTASRETMLSRAPPPDRALPPYPLPAPPSDPRTTESHDDRSSIVSLELPPLLMRDDDDDMVGESGDVFLSQDASTRSSSQKYNHTASKPATTTASFSSTMSTSSMLSSGTADTATTATTVTSAPFALLTTTSTSTSPQPQRPLYHGSPSTASSVLTIRPAAASLKNSNEKKTRDVKEPATSDTLFPHSGDSGP